MSSGIIGLYDEDARIYNPFNLELMKIAQYYKQRHNIVVLAKDFVPNYYSTFYYRHDLEPYIARPLVNYKNIILGGRLFDTKYIPLPEEIELSDYDDTIYDNYYKDITAKRHKTFLANQKRAYHLRLSTDGINFDRNILNNFDKIHTKPKIVFHDYNLTDIVNYKDIVLELYEALKHSKSPTRSIGVKYPIQFIDATELEWWNQFYHTDAMMKIQYNGLLTQEELEYLINEKKRETHLFYNPTYGVDENEFLNNQIFEVFKQAVYLHSRRVKISLIIEKNYFSDSTWIDVLTLISAYMHSERKYNKQTFYNYCRKMAHQDDRHYQNITKCYLFVSNHNPELFKMFYEYLD